MEARRRITEFGVVAEITRSILLEPRALREENFDRDIIEYADKCHLYLIGHRPMTVIDPNSMKVADDVLEGRFISYENSEDAIVDCRWRQPHLSGGASVQSTWPHNIIRILDSNGKQISRGNASYFLQWAMAQSTSDTQRLPVDAQFLDLTVTYVGKAYGADGERGAIKRLQAHSTLQRVLAELPPDRECWIILLGSDRQTNYTSIVPSGEKGDAADLEDDQHLKQGTSSQLTEGILVDVLEGCLIKYFQPKYNVQLKKTFPHATAKPLAEVYSRDLNLVGFDLDVRHLGLRLRSEEVDPSFEHGAMYELHNPAIRKNMFDFVDDIEVLRKRRGE
ncbi:hypothetical protein ACIQM0_00935 [Streptomyces sp. NPDC091387]|uniref:hypothetical protein n=1 Tax=Streptomyces sp. NPDC091387 TaxID=3365998 RepID=UPI003829BAEF